MLLGRPLTPRPALAAAAEDDTPWDWGWIAAISALVVGAVVVATDDRESRDQQEFDTSGGEDCEMANVEEPGQITIIGGCSFGG